MKREVQNNMYTCCFSCVILCMHLATADTGAFTLFRDHV